MDCIENPLCTPIMLLHRVAFVFTLIPAGIRAQQPHSALASESGVYDSSQTPPTLPWNTYNFCNAPHVSAAHYEPPDIASMGGAKLVHVLVVMRHHKVCACHPLSSVPTVKRYTRSRMITDPVPAHTGQPLPSRTGSQSAHRPRVEVLRRWCPPAHVRPRRRGNHTRRDDATQSPVRVDDLERVL